MILILKILFILFMIIFDYVAIRHFISEWDSWSYDNYDFAIHCLVFIAVLGVNVAVLYGYGVIGL